MALPPGASARDRWLERADEAHAKTQEALADGNHHMAGLWDEHERTLLRNAYEDVPFPDIPANGAVPSGIQFASVDGPSALRMVANAAAPSPNATRPLSARPANAISSASANDDHPTVAQALSAALNVADARKASSNPEVFAFMQAISAGEGDYDQLNGGGRFSGWSYPYSENRAAGAYQITPGTYDDLSRQLHLKEFSPATQDVMAAHLILTRGKGALEDILKGDVEEAAKKLNRTWTSLPGGKEAKIDMKQFKARYDANLRRLNGQ